MPYSSFLSLLHMYSHYYFCQYHNLQQSCFPRWLVYSQRDKYNRHKNQSSLSLKFSIDIFLYIHCDVYVIMLSTFMGSVESLECQRFTIFALGNKVGRALCLSFALKNMTFWNSFDIFFVWVRFTVCLLQINGLEMLTNW